MAKDKTKREDAAQESAIKESGSGVKVIDAQNHSLAPAMLIAMPQLQDSSFYRAIILLLEHGPHGSMGLILNKPIDYTLTQLAQEKAIDFNGDPKEKIFSGGPVGTERGFLLHTSAVDDESSEVITENLRISVSSLALEHLCREPKGNFRLMLGYAGWGAGQLETEIQEGAWLIHEYDPKYLFKPNTTKLWNEVLADMGIDPSMLVEAPSEVL